MKRTFRIKIRINNCDIIFKEELGPGVLGSEDIIVDLSEEEFSSPRLAAYLLDRREVLLNEIVYSELEEIT